MTKYYDNLKERMLISLNNILRNERQHFNFYLQATMELRGMERLYLLPLFEKEMAGELQHMRAFGDKIVALGGKPTMESRNFTLDYLLFMPQSRWLLEQAIKMEREVLEVYHEAYTLAEEYAVVFKDKSIVLLLEENIEHTTHDVEEMEKLLK
jgi:bacterioferritin (cytochrome b1)